MVLMLFYVVLMVVGLVSVMIFVVIVSVWYDLLRFLFVVVVVVVNVEL